LAIESSTARLTSSRAAAGAPLALAALLAGALAGCIERRAPALDGAPDAAPADLAAPDLAAPDLAAPDLAAPDLAAPDLAAPDLAAPLDLPLPAAADERCDALDNDLDGRVDEGVSNSCGGCGEPRGGRPCVALSAELIEQPATLDPTKLFSAGAGAPPAESFSVEGVTCARVTSALRDPLPALGAARVRSPLADLTLVPTPALGGRYAPNGGEEDWAPLALHRPGDEVSIAWGLDADADAPRGGLLTLRAPADLDEVDLGPLVDAFSGRAGAPARLRWTPRGVAAAPSALPAEELTLYVGASSPLTPMGLSRAIAHTQMRLTLSDDGLFELPAALTVARAGSSLWVYLERAARDWRDLGGGDAAWARAGTRVEARAAPTGGAPSAVPLRVSAPRVDDEALDLREGLRVRWALEPGAAVVGLSLSLISQGEAGYEALTCDGLDPARGALTLPADRLPDLSARAALRQLTLRADLRRAAAPLPDRGELSESVSVLLQLPPAP